MLISNEVFFSEENYEYFIGCEDDDYKIGPLYIIFPKMSGHPKHFAEDTRMSFLIKDDELLEKYEYDKICDKFSNSIDKRFTVE